MYLLQIGFDYHQINLRQIFYDFQIDFNLQVEVTSKIQTKIKEEGTSLIYVQKFQGKLTLSIHAWYFEALQINIILHVELKVEAQQIQSTVEINLFYFIFF